MKTNSKPQLILVGGPSSVGKTTVVSGVIKLFPERFTRPRSYTSRPRRCGENDDEYVFVTEAEILEGYARGDYVTLDYVYGNYYAISRQSLYTILAQGLSPIKEVHPENHGKFLRDYPELISCVLMPLPGNQGDNPSALSERSNIDNTYYRELDLCVFDLVLYVSRHTAIENSAIRLFRLLQFLLSGDYPRPSLIDRINREGYSRMGKDFIDEKRKTTANFHASSEFFLSGAISQLEGGSRCLELGPGSGWLRKSFEWPNVKYEALDITDAMATLLSEHGVKPKLTVSPVRCMPFEDGSFDCILSSLADGFMHPIALLEIWRVLKPGGIFVFTAPSSEWSDRLRSTTAHDMTTFSLEGGDVSVYSFTHTKEELLILASKCGFETTEAFTPSWKTIQRDHVLSDAILSATRSPRGTTIDFSLLNCMTWRKIHERIPLV